MFNKNDLDNIKEELKRLGLDKKHKIKADSVLVSHNNEYSVCKYNPINKIFVGFIDFGKRKDAKDYFNNIEERVIRELPKNEDNNVNFNSRKNFFNLGMGHNEFAITSL